MSEIARELGKLLGEAGATLRIGLRQQGHLPTVERMLAEGASWEAIGRAIGWDGKAARKWYELEREGRSAMGEHAPGCPAFRSGEAIRCTCGAAPREQNYMLQGGGCWPPAPDGAALADREGLAEEKPTGNWHEITGPNGICACGTVNGGCPERLESHINQRIDYWHAIARFLERERDRSIAELPDFFARVDGSLAQKILTYRMFVTPYLEAAKSSAVWTDREGLAEQIARDLFVNGQGQRAVRLVLVDAHGRDLGGWGETVVADRIAAALRAAPRSAAEEGEKS